jgi:hypothetical protein
MTNPALENFCIVPPTANPTETSKAKSAELPEASHTTPGARVAKLIRRFLGKLASAFKAPQNDPSFWAAIEHPNHKFLDHWRENQFYRWY